MAGKEKKIYDAVFVDFFDTLMFRRVTPHQLMERWAFCIGRKYPEFSEETVQALPEIRKRIFEESRQKLEQQKLVTGRSEIDYYTGMKLVYKRISPEAEEEECERFIETSRQIETALECGCQYPNRKLANWLEDMCEAGKKIYIVSDYYLSAREIQIFLRAADIPEVIFEDIFVSSDLGKRKASGDIYPYLLELLEFQADQIFMIGDDKTSDIENAGLYGIQTSYRSSVLHRTGNYLRQKLGMRFEELQFAWSAAQMYYDGPEYAEYIGIFYEFTRRLYRQLKEEKIHQVSFMAREGFYLRRLFEEYQKLVKTDSQYIRNLYFRCSRRSVLSGAKEAHTPEAVNEKISIRNWLKSLDIPVPLAKEYVDFDEKDIDKAVDLKESEIYRQFMNSVGFLNLLDMIIKENHKVFLDYISRFLDKGKFCFVDSGWKCTIQNALQKYYGISTEGFYIGVQKPEIPTEDLKKHGLIFQEADQQSRYYHYLGMNIPFYQQLLAAPHGSAVKYISLEDQILIEEEWDPMERELYEEWIQEVQENMFLKFCGICVWDPENINERKRDWQIAKLSMKSSLFASETRLEFIRHCTENYVQNFQQEKRGSIAYDHKKVRLRIDFLWNPDKLLRYVSKVQRTSLYDRRLIRILYPPAAGLLYGYIILVQKIKDFFSRK